MTNPILLAGWRPTAIPQNYEYRNANNRYGLKVISLDRVQIWKYIDDKMAIEDMYLGPTKKPTDLIDLMRDLEIINDDTYHGVRMVVEMHQYGLTTGQMHACINKAREIWIEKRMQQY